MELHNRLASETMQMRTLMRILVCVCILAPEMLLSQNLQDKLSVGGKFGPNLWVNDMNSRRVGLGFEAFAKYGLDKYFSLGAVLGVEGLKAGQLPPDPPRFPFDYLRATTLTFSAQGWLYFSPGNRFSPYVFLGLGATYYSRKDGSGNPYPNDNTNSSMYVPIGLGFEAFVARNTSVSFDIGYRILDQNTDNFPSGGSDGFSAARVGIVVYFGSNEDDDDDGDGVSNGLELELKLDPHNPDTDGDGLSDGDELLKYKTDPRKADTDGDGLKDGDEVWRFRTDPLKADTDKDGLTDGEEVSKYNTDPLKVDTDKDGLSDGEEVLIYHTDPLKADTDDDGLTDSNELFGYKTDPLKADTDGGGVNDGVEVKRGTNPLNPNDDFPATKKEETKAELGLIAIQGTIKFKPNSTQFTLESEETLTRVLELLTRNTEYGIEIRGYTDDRGPRASNIRLSYNRAAAVKRWLEQRGVESARLTAKGFGPENPIAPNTDEEGWEKNRRIEFFRTR